MKFLKGLLVLGLIGLGGVFLQASGSTGQKDYEDELRDKKAKVEEYLDQVDGVEKEFVEKILAREDMDHIVEVWEVTNIDTGESYKNITAIDSSKEIEISARIPGLVFYRKGNYRTWIDPNKKTYYSEFFDYSKNKDRSDDIISSNEYTIYEKFLTGYDKSVEKIGDTYKVTYLDDLNKGSYSIYDLEGNCIESFTDNSQGRWKDILISKSSNVEEFYNKFEEMKNTYNEVGSIGEIKN